MRNELERMAERFHPRAAGNLQAEIEFVAVGEQEGYYVLSISDGQCSVWEGRAQHPKLRVKASPEVLRRLTDDGEDGERLVREGRIRATGELALLRRFREFFPLEREERPPRYPGGPVKVRGDLWFWFALFPWVLLWFSLERDAPTLHAGLWFAAVAGMVFFFYRWLYIEVTLLDWSTLIVPLAMVGGYLADPAFTERFGLPLGFAALAVCLLLSLRSSTPLTSRYTQWNYTFQERSKTAFTRSNALATLLWGLAFLLVGAGLLAVVVLFPGLAWIRPLLSVLFVPPVAVTLFLPSIARTL